MPLNRAVIGRSTKSEGVLVVTEDTLRDAAAQFEEPLAAYRDPEAARSLGHPAPIAPPAFASRLWFRMVWAWPMYEPDLGRKPGANLLLADLHTVSFRPIRLGDRLTLTSTVADITEISRQRDIIHIQNEIATEDGEPVCGTGYKFVISHADTFDPAAGTETEGLA
ncbi:MaoC family dehydratase N-terminal domain-containing protein [Streptomyces bungoensis]|uniref:FAS1-like dehydratase domain-containing protein n=1 Tax=Streptomyces bungoensis TaxID=285568 RepID=UPI00341CE47B